MFSVLDPKKGRNPKSDPMKTRSNHFRRKTDATLSSRDMRHAVKSISKLFRGFIETYGKQVYLHDRFGFLFYNIFI